MKKKREREVKKKREKVRIREEKEEEEGKKEGSRKRNITEREFYRVDERDDSSPIFLFSHHLIWRSCVLYFYISFPSTIDTQKGTHSTIF